MRAAYVILFIEVLRKYGRVNETALCQFNLPVSLCSKPDAYVPMQKVRSFMSRGTCQSGIEDIGLQVGLGLTINAFDTELQRTLLRSQSLEFALQRFCDLAVGEQSCAAYRIIYEQDEVRICCSLDTDSPSGLDNVGEWLQIMSLITIIRQFTDETWTPKTITFHSQYVPGECTGKEFPHSRLLTGQKETGIEFPASILGNKNTSRFLQAEADDGSDDMIPVPYQPAMDFPGSLQKILQAHLDNGYPTIELASQITCTSVRTLQRRLKQFGMSYTDVVKKARFEVASRVLKNPGTKVIEASFAVGYDDPSHFSRAFKQYSGLSPQQYRSLNVVAAL
jgi:AraC-like DNA-binding protein